RTGLADSDTARRLGLRASPVVRAVVGLDRQRKKDVEQILFEHLHQKRQSRDTVLACLALAAALPCEQQHLADLGTRLLTEQVNRPGLVVREVAGPNGTVQQVISFISQGDLQRVLAAAEGLTGGLTPPQADAHARAVLAAIEDKADAKGVRNEPTVVSD